MPCYDQRVTRQSSVIIFTHQSVVSKNLYSHKVVVEDDNALVEVTGEAFYLKWGTQHFELFCEER